MAVLRAAVALPLIAETFASVLEPAAASAASAPRTMRRVRPFDPAWPDARNWTKLKEAVGGRLIAAHSMFGTCGRDPDGPACLDALEDFHNPRLDRGSSSRDGSIRVDRCLDAFAERVRDQSEIRA